MIVAAVHVQSGGNQRIEHGIALVALHRCLHNRDGFIYGVGSRTDPDLNQWPLIGMVFPVAGCPSAKTGRGWHGGQAYQHQDQHGENNKSLLHDCPFLSFFYGMEIRISSS